MVASQSGPRVGRLGKLAEVLDHLLRIGGQDEAEKIIAAHKARGLTPPDHLLAPPLIKPQFYVYWEAFQGLQTARVTARGTIPINAILDYADRYGLDPDTLKRIVWKTDAILLEHWKGVEAAEERQAESNAAQRPAISGGTS